MPEISYKFVGQPNNLRSILTPDEIKAKMDLGPEEVRDFLNSFIALLGSTSADNWLYQQIVTAVLSGVVDGSLTDVKLSNSVGQIKDRVSKLPIAGSIAPGNALNNVITSGFTLIDSATLDTPGVGGSGSTCITSTYEVGNQEQIYLGRTLNAVYYRRQTAGVWQPWVKILTNDDMATQAEAKNGTSLLKIITPSTLRGLTTGTAITSDTLRASLDSISTNTTTTYVKKKAFNILLSGSYRVKFALNMPSGGAALAQGRIYKNGVAVGTIRQTNSATYTTYSEDLSFVAGDTCELWISIDSAGFTANAKEFRLYFNEQWSAMSFDLLSADIPTSAYNVS